MLPREAVALLLLAALTGGCSQPSSQVLPPPLPTGQTLRVAAFPGYLPAALQTDFESKTGNKLSVETYNSSEELLARLAGGTRYDVVFPSGYAVEQLIAAGRLAPMQRQLVPKVGNVPVGFRNPPMDAGLEHCIPYTWSILGLAVRPKSKSSDVSPDRWLDLFETKPLPGEMSMPKLLMLDDMRASIGVALRYLNHSASSRQRADLLDAQKLLLSQLQRSPDYVKDPSLPLRSGEVALALSWSSPIFDLMRKRAEVRFVLPSEGTLLNIDYACVLVGSAELDVAFSFLNYLLDPFVAAETTNTTMLAIVNQGARQLLEPDGRGMWSLFDSVISRGQTYELLRDVGPAQAIYEETWRTVKAELKKRQAAQQVGTPPASP
jgi:spermidine/putrescine-binding protein